MRKSHCRDAGLDGRRRNDVFTCQPALAAFAVALPESAARTNEKVDVVGVPVRAVLYSELPELHEAIPERLSEPLAWKSTGWLYQPFESGPRESATDTDGRVPSYLIGPKVVWPLVFPA